MKINCTEIQFSRRFPPPTTPTNACESSSTNKYLIVELLFNLISSSLLDCGAEKSFFAEGRREATSTTTTRRRIKSAPGIAESAMSRIIRTYEFSFNISSGARLVHALASYIPLPFAFDNEHSRSEADCKARKKY